MTVYGDSAYQCSAPPAGSARRDLANEAEALAAARAWLVERDLLPADCWADAQAWPGSDGLGWQVSFRRRISGAPVGSHWGLSSGVRLRLNSAGQVDAVSYVGQRVNEGGQAALKGVQTAWEELQSLGPAAFDAENPQISQYGTFNISKVELGYREQLQGIVGEETLLTPYYIFSGLAELPNAQRQVHLVAYVPAQSVTP